MGVGGRGRTRTDAPLHCVAQPLATLRNCKLQLTQTKPYCRKNPRDVLSPLLCDPSSLEALLHLPLALAFYCKNFHVGGMTIHSLEPEVFKFIQASGSMALATRAYFMGYRAVDIPLLKGQSPAPGRRVMSISATPDFYGQPVHSGVLVRVPPGEDLNFTGQASYWYGTARIIFSLRGAAWEAGRTPGCQAVFVLVHWFAGVRNSYHIPGPQPAELKEETR